MTDTAEYFTHITSFSPHNNPQKIVLEKLHSFPRITQILSTEAQI